MTLIVLSHSAVCFQMSVLTNYLIFQLGFTFSNWKISHRKINFFEMNTGFKKVEKAAQYAKILIFQLAI
jgi:hypothetical protein